MSRRRAPQPAHSRTGLAVLLVFALMGLVVCVAALSLAGRFTSEPGSRQVILNVAYSPEKGELFQQLAESFNDGNPRLPSGKRIQLVATEIVPEEMVELAGDNTYQAVSPDSSIWLGEIDRKWMDERQVDTGLVGETTRFMVSPVVIGMWKDVATSLGYPTKNLGWEDLLRAASENPQFKWSHPSTSTASGLLAVLAQFYAGTGTTRGLTEEAATNQATLDYVARLERTVKHYGEGELAVMEQIEQQGREYLDAFVVQEQMIVRHNTQHGADLVAIYPFEGTMWEDHPLALLEHPDRTDEERLAYRLLREFLLSPETQKAVLSHGYRPTDLNIPLDGPDSPIRAENGVDPAQPYTTLQIPGPSVISVVRNVWWYTKRQANIYLIVDVSGSMDGRKLQDAQAALRAFVGQIQGDMERVGLIAFSSMSREIVPLTQIGEGRGRIEQAINQLAAGGNTGMLDAVALAHRKLSDLNDAERINAIVVMTDGKENASRTRLDELTIALRRSQEGTLPIVVFCIAYGRDADFEMLEAISGASGGFTRQGELETIEDLYKTLSTYF